MNAVAITGATGFIGRHAVAHLRQSGYHVTAISRKAPLDSARQFITCDYLDEQSLRAAIAGHESVVHIAGLAHVASGISGVAERDFGVANVESAVCVANAARDSGCRRLVLLSSAGIMGEKSPTGGFKDEDSPQPYDAYTRSKYLAECRLRQLGRADFTVIALRPPMVYGPGAPGAFQRLTMMIDQGLPLPIGAVTAKRSVMGIRNLCGAIAAAIEADSDVHGAMLVSDAVAISVPDFVLAMCHALHRRPRLFSVPPVLLRFAAHIAGRRADVRRAMDEFVLAGTLAKSELGWIPRHSTESEIEWAVEAVPK